MTRVHELRENAERCLRLSKSINVAADVAWLEGLAAESTQAAERIEAEEVASAAEQCPMRRSAEESPYMVRFGDVALDGSDALLDRNIVLTADESPDRRRPGRRDEVRPDLIPFLREDFLSGLPAEPTPDGPDHLKASRGIIIWALISVALWLPLTLWIVGRVR
jgi:hypothetical protein